MRLQSSPGMGSHVTRVVGYSVLLFLILPTAIIVPVSLTSSPFLALPPPSYSGRWYAELFSRSDYVDALISSTKIGVPTAAFATLLGTLAALGVSRGGLKSATVIASVIVAPLVLPHIVLAIGLYPMMVTLGLIGTYSATVIGHTVVAIPVAFISVMVSLSAVGIKYETASMSLGATPIVTFRWITLPLIKPGIVVAFIFSFALSFDELILALFLSSTRTRTIPMLLWEQLNNQLTPVIAAATIVILCMTLILLLVSGIFTRGRGTE